jgi:hypothetical protein
MISALLALALAADPLQAPAPSPPVQAAAPTVDPARLEAARRMVDAMFPVEGRAAYFESMMAPMIANIEISLMQSPQLAEMMKDNPEAQALLASFTRQQIERSTQVTAGSLPQLFEAMTGAYARRFTVAQLNETAAFYATPTGRALMEGMPQVMADPAITAVQTAMMEKAMANVQADTMGLVTQLMALSEERRPDAANGLAGDEPQ